MDNTKSKASISIMAIIGLSVMVISYSAAWYCLLSSVSYYTGIFFFWVSCFFYIAGAFFLLLGSSTWKSWLIILIPVLTFIPIVLFIIHLKATKTNYILPKDFSKPFVVVYDEKNGVSPKKEGARWVMNIPDDGILVLDTIISYADDVEDNYYMPGNNGLQKLKYDYSATTCYLDANELTEITIKRQDSTTYTIKDKSCMYALFSKPDYFPGPEHRKIIQTLITAKVDSLRRVGKRG